MKVAGFSFIRNAVANDYPIVEAITSILPICDEFVVAVGKSDDDTLQLIKNIKSPKIKILETVWDDTQKEGGRAFALESNKAFKAISADADWCFYIQGDECVHEKYLDTIKQAMLENLEHKNVEGLLFNYKHFYGSYDYFAHSRRWYRKEIRIVRNLPDITSYRDAQGFRKGNQKIQVKAIEAEIYHYGWVKPPKGLTKKMKNFETFYNPEAKKIEQYSDFEAFDYGNADELIKFETTHPAVMHERIARVNWTFNFDPTAIKRELKGKKKLMFWVEKTFGVRLFEYRNYKKIS